MVDSTAQTADGASNPSLREALEARVNAHAAARGWGPAQQNKKEKHLADLAALGEAAGRQAGGPLSEAQATVMARELLAKDEQAQAITGKLRESRSSVVGGAAKASGSALGGAVKGAAVASVLAIVTRPLAYLANKLTGGATKNLFSAKNIITIGALYSGGKDVFKSVYNSYAAPTVHNRSMDKITLDTVTAGIMKASAARSAGQPGTGPQAGSPDSPGPGGPEGPSPQPAGPQSPAEPNVTPTAQPPAAAASGTPASMHDARQATVDALKAQVAAAQISGLKSVSGPEDASFVAKPPSSDDLGLPPQPKQTGI